MNQEQILHLIVHVLHALGRAAKSTAIAEYAKSSSFVQHAVSHSFNVDEFADVHTLSSRITSTINSHINNSTAS